MIPNPPKKFLEPRIILSFPVNIKSTIFEYEINVLLLGSPILSEITGDALAVTNVGYTSWLTGNMVR